MNIQEIREAITILQAGLKVCKKLSIQNNISPDLDKKQFALSVAIKTMQSVIDAKIPPSIYLKEGYCGSDPKEFIYAEDFRLWQVKCMLELENLLHNFDMGKYNIDEGTLWQTIGDDGIKDLAQSLITYLEGER